MTGCTVTLLVEDFKGLVRAADPAQRYPALEKVLARGKPLRVASTTANHLRFSLFGIDPSSSFPVAALTHLANHPMQRKDDNYWLRADPVTMRADMAQVFLTGQGFADLDADEREAIGNCVRDVLSQEGFESVYNDSGCWCIALPEPLDFQFTPLDQALGMDVADALPGQAEAQNWRRLLNELQVALHHCPVNTGRRQRGQQEINSVWFWGGGVTPQPSPQNSLTTVYSDQPVTRGLAILHDCELENQDQAEPDSLVGGAASLLIDWLPATASAQSELERLESLVRCLLTQVIDAAASLTLFDRGGRGWRLDRRASRRFWKRTSPLATMNVIAGDP